ncbi:four-carbon acid sugar kinase family protein [Synechococcus sp. A15-24]|uniref:four-carbon acid sugar kinase family protein n=1 Tax=Synechococcus sp. A15-24 TaxID=1050635 RepID=UPI0016494AD9|nr:four-carbon acid sugar kinase family protein [Synechococcus sp. A15-24]QNJ27936.1 putative sugar and nucleotide-binding domains containing protein [Synechococcus sp. A15-24]
MKVVVIDDDPTGSQTVHSCPLLLEWDEEILRRGLRHPSPLLFLLADTRALTPEDAAARNREIVRHLDEALAAEGLGRGDVLLVSRGDSTLRGHGVLEPVTLQEAFGPFDATFHIPAFLEGGRTTRNGVHLLNGEPVHTTAFAKDRIFGFSTSDLANWLDEKSGGLIRSAEVQRIDVRKLDAAGGAGLPGLIDRLRSLKGNAPVVVDAERQDQLNALAAAVRALRSEKRFLFRSAASMVKALADPGPQPLDAAGLAGLRRRASDDRALPGLVMVGSYVALADQQLERLLVEPGCRGVELPVPRIARVLEGPTPDLLLADLERVWLQQLQELLGAGLTPVLFTSRGELRCASEQEGRRLSCALAELMARLAAALAPDLGYLISKGGTTTQTLLSKGLGLTAVQLEGQLLPGLSLVRSSEGRHSGLPIITFPGNLGSADTLRDAWQRMEAG